MPKKRNKDNTSSNKAHHAGIPPNRLPTGWAITTLGNIVVPSRGRGLPDEHPELPYVGMEHIESQTMRLLAHGQASDVRSSSVLFKKGDVLYGKMRPYLNKVWVADFDGFCSAEFLVFPCPEGINSRFLALRLNAQDFVTFANQSVSGDRPRVDYDSMAAFPILLPPSAEQERIVAKLDAMLSRISAGESAARRALERLDCYRATVLHAAVTGELTSEWRKTHKPEETGKQLLKRLLIEHRKRWEEIELKRYQTGGKLSNNDNWKRKYPRPTEPNATHLPLLPRGWAWASLDQLGELNRGKSKHRPRDDERLYGGPYPFIQTGDIRKSDGTIREHRQTYSDFGLKQSRLWPTGTLCITIAANIAETGLLTYPACFPDSVVGFIQGEDVLRVRFIEFFIRSEKARLEQYAPATAQKNINLAFLRALAVPLPPLQEQTEIVREGEHRLKAANTLASKLSYQLNRALSTRQSISQEAFFGNLIPQDPNDETAGTLLERLNTTCKELKQGTVRRHSQKTRVRKFEGISEMNLSAPPPEALVSAWSKMDHALDAHKLFVTAGYTPNYVVSFYENLRSNEPICNAFRPAPCSSVKIKKSVPSGSCKTPNSRFRLIMLWLKDFKNLKDYKVLFDPNQGVDVVLGWNGAGKSNLFEVLVIIFRDLHYWWEKNKWPEEPMNAYKLTYEIDNSVVNIEWDPEQMKRPEVSIAQLSRRKKAVLSFEPIKRDELPLPRFIFAYYPGPTNRLAEHFLPMKRDHYERLRRARSDDPETLAKLLEQRRFFCAETHHAKYVLLAFSYKEDQQISAFLENRLRIVGFESALFIIRKPRWAKPGGTPDNFWGATGIMFRVMQKLRQYAIAPMVLDQTVIEGYHSTSEKHYYFFLPDINRLRDFASEYVDARAFFLALESTDFSELIYDVKIQVRVKAENNELLPITFRELSEGEQQLLTVLGLMRFTKSHQSLVLLDEPDTHLNPHWSVEFLKDLASVISDKANKSPEQQTSQLLMATHDPLVIASLLKEQIHLLKRDPDSLRCYWEQASINPRGLGFTGILTSDMFGFRSDLDPETLADLDNRVRLIAEETLLSAKEKSELETIDKRLAEAGFSKAFSDPYYAAFVRAWGRRYADQMAGKQVLTKKNTAVIDRIAKEVLAEAVAEVEKEVEAHALH